MENGSASRSILVVDDDATNLRMLQEILKPMYKVYASPSGERALGFLENHAPDLIIIDMEMSGMNGYEFLRRLKSDERLARTPALFLATHEDRDKEEAFKLGAVDYIPKPVAMGVVRARVGLHMELENYRRRLGKLARQNAEAPGPAQDSVFEILSRMMAWRDGGRGGHIERVVVYADMVVRGLVESDDPEYRITPQYGVHIIKAAKLHDIGHVAIPDSILLKPGKLTPEEFAVMKKHTVIGAQIIGDAARDPEDGSNFLAVAREIAASHHEWWDGAGYPNALSGSEIPISGRVMAVTDVYDSLTSDRPYKAALTHEEAMEIIREETDRHFDPRMIELLERIFPLFAEVSSAI
jgi:putative two-component system response regulator